MTEKIIKKKCEFCGQKVAEDKLTPSRDPWDNYKEKLVCLDANTCAKRGRDV